MALEQWLIFVAVWIAAGLPLGPNAVNCITVAATEGFARALWPIAGVLLASFTHMTATILGVATLLAANAELFQALKLIGAGYLIWMGIALWRRRDTAVAIERRAPASAIRLARRGFLISMTNPKAVFVYLAIFSQFIASSQALVGQLAVLVPTATVITALIYLGYAVMGLGIGRLLATVRRRLIFNRAIGSFYVLAGLGLATTSTSAALPQRP